MLKELIISMRPQQWYKNLILFVCIIFSQNLLNIPMWSIVLSAFIIFCMISGASYIINDILDIEKDRIHPKKTKRPIASGSLNKNYALISSIILIISSIGWSYFINTEFFVITIAFFTLNIAYSVFLKHIILVDVLTISVNFVIRAIAGCLAINVIISPWLILCTFLLALFLALGKRRHELMLLGTDAISHREFFRDYTTSLLDQMISISTSTLIISYALYTFLQDNIYMMITIPFAIYGLFRYMLLIHAKNFGGETEMIFKDNGMLISMGLWFMIVILVLYGKDIL
ncbi:MAG: decaprenyl-phosphate phosphoribosyltransferase [archaeon]